jgi:hypothetical protein
VTGDGLARLGHDVGVTPKRVRFVGAVRAVDQHEEAWHARRIWRLTFLEQRIVFDGLVSSISSPDMILTYSMVVLLVVRNLFRGLKYTMGNKKNPALWMQAGFSGATRDNRKLVAMARSELATSWL